MKATHFTMILFAGIMLAFSCGKMETTLSESGQEGLKASSVNPAIIPVDPEGPMYDTENLLEAFAMAESIGKGSVIRLAEGVFYLDKLDIYNFHGTLMGAGKGKTIIHTIPGGIQLPVESPFIDTNPYFINFHGGDITVSGITFDISDDNPVKPYDWWTGGDVTFLCAVIRISGLSVEDYSASAALRDLSFKGKYVSLYEFTPFNIDNCVLIGGGYATCALGGNFSVQNCDFEVAETGVNSIGLSHANIIVGGSAGQGNRMENVNAGVAFVSGDQSNVKISNNIMSDILAYGGIQLVQDYIPSDFNFNVEPSGCNFLIYQNKISMVGYYPDGLSIYDIVGLEDVSRQSKAVIRDNFFRLTTENQTAIAGYWAYNSNFQQNIITGASAFAVLLYANSSGCKLIFNNFDNYEPAWTDILLYTETYDNMVICETNLTSVYDASGLNIIKGPAEIGKEVDISDYLTVKMKKHHLD